MAIPAAHEGGRRMEQGAGMRLMIVDDDVNFQESLSREVMREGHRVTRFSNPEQALNWINRHAQQVDAVLLDLRMTGMTGLELLDRLRTNGHEHPAVIITGFSDIQTASEAVHLGICGLLLKPFKLFQLKRTLRKLEFEHLKALRKSGTNMEALMQEQGRNWKDLLVELLRVTLECWEQAGGTRRDLAEQSRLWRVTLDKQSHRMRTLERYCEIETLPARPNWRKVLDTANFVLRHTERSQYKIDLETKTRLLEQTLELLGMKYPDRRPETLKDGLSQNENEP